ncbi:MAG: DUF429 domain-containing protein [Acidobacteria bacterium]|nr:MAG: DUF429 domain-containing protein [Acidobacteriota bacterium]MCE7956536.1 DUF429 domain-containing protein [Acidobacteria bacterium ACB2]
MKVAGIDGTSNGWVAVVLQGGKVAAVRPFADFASAIEGLRDTRFIAIDIPIGLPRTGPRQADVLARKRLGVRGSSVFTVPPRRVLEAADYEAAKRIAAPGRKPSRQVFGIREKILQVNDSPLLDSRVFEVHPEVSFCEMAGEPLPSKKTWNGLWRRIHLLAREGIDLPKDFGEAADARPDDVLDAAAAAWTALRKSARRAGSLPDPPETLAGRQVAIWF